MTVKTARNRYPFGIVTITAHTHKADKDTVWRLATHDYPAEFVKRFTPAKFIETIARGMVKNVKGKLTDPKPIKHGGRSGIEFQVAPADPKGYAIAGRLFTIGGRVHQLTLVARPKAAAFKDAEKFFDSFKPAKQLR